MTDARSPEHDSHPLKGRWRPASPYVWGGHVSPQFVLVLVLAHAVVAGWFVSDWDQARMVLYDFHEVHSEGMVNVPPEALARDYGYAEDPVDALRRYKAIAAPLVAGATTAGERARRLGDYIYSLRSPTPGSLKREGAQTADNVISSSLNGTCDLYWYTMSEPFEPQSDENGELITPEGKTQDGGDEI